MKDRFQPLHGLPACIDNHGIVKATTQLRVEIAAVSWDPTAKMFKTFLATGKANVNGHDNGNGTENGNASEVTAAASTEMVVNANVNSGVIGTPGRGSSEPNIYALAGGALDTEMQERMNKLTMTISALQEFVQTKHNVHSEIKRMIFKIKTEVQSVAEGLRKRSSSQASAARGTGATNQLHKPEIKLPEIQWGTPVGKINPDRKTITEKRGRDTDGWTKVSAPKQRKVGAGKEGTSKTLHRNEAPQKSQGKGKKMTRRPRADAIVVEKTGDKSYAEILKMMKNDESLKAVSDRVTRIKRNQKGQMMFELKKGETGCSEGLHDTVHKALKDVATVRVLTQEVAIVCRDMDEVTTKEELLKALADAFVWGSLPETAIRSMRESYGGTQTAIISLSFEQAKKALAAGKVKIGWTICRLSEAVRPKMCFRCLDFGHMAKDCKNEDRSKLCRKCGTEGHIAKDCNKDPQCLLCKDGDKTRPHITGSSRCPMYRSAAKTIRK